MESILKFPKRTKQPEPNPKALEEILDELCKYGKPRVSRMERGWYSSIDMHVSSAGAAFQVASEFNHETAREAAAVCLDRVVKCLSDLDA